MCLSTAWENEDLSSAGYRPCCHNHAHFAGNDVNGDSHLANEADGRKHPSIPSCQTMDRRQVIYTHRRSESA